MYLNELATSSDPTVEAPTQELQGLEELTQKPLSKVIDYWRHRGDVSPLDAVYQICKCNGHCDLSVKEMHEKEIAFLCNYQGHMIITRGPEPHFVPVANHSYEIIATLNYHFVNDRLKIKGIRILDMKK